MLSHAPSPGSTPLPRTDSGGHPTFRVYYDADVAIADATTSYLTWLESYDPMGLFTPERDSTLFGPFTKQGVYDFSTTLYFSNTNASQYAQFVLDEDVMHEIEPSVSGAKVTQNFRLYVRSGQILRVQFANASGGSTTIRSRGRATPSLECTLIPGTGGMSWA